METKKSQKILQKFVCNSCDYFTSNKYDFKKHKTTRKHIALVLSSKNKGKETEKSQKSQDVLSCEICFKPYKSRSGLWKHLKTCNVTINDGNGAIVKTANISDKELFLKVLKDNEEMRKLMKDQQTTISKQQNQITELIPKIGNTNNNFNLNIFLNETCKNAINFTDFLNSISLKVEDLAETRRLGYVNSISNIFIRGLRQLDMHERPIHCSNIKNEVLYIKDNDEWQKENEEKSKIKTAINVVTKKQIEKIKEWEELNPNWNKTEKGTTEYMEIIKNIMGNEDDACDKSNNKIIKTIAKEVVINK